MTLQFTKLCDLSKDKCSLGCPTLDNFLGGGLTCGMVTELTGEPGAGKTQLCMQVLQTVQWSRTNLGLEGSALCAVSDSPVPVGKVIQDTIDQCNDSANQGLGRSCLDNIFVERDVTTPDELLNCLRAAEQLLQRQSNRPVRLIVIDSIANIFRDVGDNPGVAELHTRTGLLFQVSALLKRYAACYNLAVLVVNQVMDAVEVVHGVVKASGLLSSGRRVLPSLGLAWAHCVNVRLFLARASTPDSSERKLQVVFAPHLQQGGCRFTIDTSGVHGVPH